MGSGSYAAPQRNRFLRSYRKHPDHVMAAVILIPILGWWFVVVGFPTMAGCFLGFFEWHKVTDMPKWNGIRNFIGFFTNPNYVQVLRNSLWIGFTATGVTIGFGFVAALLMNLPIFGRGLYRTIWYIPAVTSTAAIAQIFNLWIDPSQYGILNNVLGGLGIRPIVWGYSTGWMAFWIVAYSAWRGIGASAILWLAGLQSVNPQLHEAARIDGANEWQCFRYVTIPQLRPFSTFIVINGCISAVQIYEQVLFISKGGPFGSTDVLMSQIYRDAFFDLNLGMAGAATVVLAAVIFVFVAVNWMLREKEGIVNV